MNRSPQLQDIPFKRVIIIDRIGAKNVSRTAVPFLDYIGMGQWTVRQVMSYYADASE